MYNKYDKKSVWLKSFFIVIFSIVFFASVYYFLGERNNGLVKHGRLATYPEALSYSFSKLVSGEVDNISAIGYSEIISVMESMIGLVIFGYIISKFFSREQEKILKQLYRRERMQILQRHIDGTRICAHQLANVIEVYNNSGEINVDIPLTLSEYRRVVNDLGKTLIDAINEKSTIISDKKLSSVLKGSSILFKKVFIFVGVMNKLGRNNNIFRERIVELLDVADGIFTQELFNTHSDELNLTCENIRRNIMRTRKKLARGNTPIVSG